MTSPAKTCWRICACVSTGRFRKIDMPWMTELRLVWLSWIDLHWDRSSVSLVNRCCSRTSRDTRCGNPCQARHMSIQCCSITFRSVSTPIQLIFNTSVLFWFVFMMSPVVSSCSGRLQNSLGSLFLCCTKEFRRHLFWTQMIHTECRSSTPDSSNHFVWSAISQLILDHRSNVHNYFKVMEQIWTS